MKCGHQTTTPDYSKLTLPPRCSECEGPIRPQVVLFEEELPHDKHSRLWYELGAGFDLIFSIGTSSMFEYIIEPVRVGRKMGITTEEINPETTTISSEVDIKIAAGAANVLTSIWERYLTWWPWA
jgi:NAD-dependent deacetylase